MGKVDGQVVNKEGEPLVDAFIYLKNTNISASIRKDGSYQLLLKSGNYELICYKMGYITQSKTITIDNKQDLSVSFTLIEDPSTELAEVNVTGKSVLQRVKESAYNVVALDAKKLANTTADIAEALEKASGVKIKKSGGVGSKTSISLNGFSGNHVKVFMDGIPMNGFGSAFQINNIPAGLAERIEVYKGVIPIELGSDALGGAINIITSKSTRTLLDASYSYGSFNTHKTNINFRKTNSSGFTVSINAFQNYSDNSYQVKTLLLNLDEGSDNYNKYSEKEYWFKRFHDNYHNETVIAKLGVVNKSWADKLLIGATLGNEKADIQNANLMRIAYGGKKRKATTKMATLAYQKKNFLAKNLTLTASGNYSKVHNTSIDTLARQYNWKGEYIVKKVKGEGEYSFKKFNNKSGIGIINLRYTPSEKHQFALNNLISKYSRTTTDDKATSENSTGADSMDRTNMKNVLGISYKIEPNKKWNTSLFGKWYVVNVTGPIDTSTTSSSTYVEKHEDFQATGYGIATSYNLTHDIQFKASFEKTYRLPSQRELFGDEILETGDVSLKPENSRNINFNMVYTNTSAQFHHISVDAGFVYRDIRDYIRRQIEQKYGGAFYTNHGKVKNLGIDLEARYSYKQLFYLGGNITFQNIRNKEKYDIYGRESIIFNDRIPNVPYSFGNFNTSYLFANVMGSSNTLSIVYYLNYTHEFFRSWESEGGKDAKVTIPEQLSHDINLIYTLKSGKYNISFIVQNITDELLYDNYSLQKPGRSISVKLRYFLYK